MQMLKEMTKKAIEDAEACGFATGEITSFKISIKFHVIGRRYDDVQEILNQILSFPTVKEITYIYCKADYAHVPIDDLRKLMEDN